VTVVERMQQGMHKASMVIPLASNIHQSSMVAIAPGTSLNVCHSRSFLTLFIFSLSIDCLVYNKKENYDSNNNAIMILANFLSIHVNYITEMPIREPSI
jgi:hypothetical protein